MRNAVFVDTSYVLALEIADDFHHGAAQAHWKSVVHNLPPLIKTSYVLDEIATFFNSRGLHYKAVQVVNNFLNSSSVEIVHISEVLFDAGWILFQKHDDKRYSLTDCISFVAMQQREIFTALTFDKHFAQAGFIIQP